MKENTVVITEKAGGYEIQNNGISEFALLGILECIVFDMKSARRGNGSIEQKTLIEEPKQEAQEQIVQDSGSSNLRNRISNAVKAIRSLGGEIEDIDRSTATDEELQAELEDLTNQYKRLKNSRGNK